MKICSVCQRCYEDAALDCEENHGSLVAARSGTREIIANYRLDFLLERDATGETYQATRSGFDQPFIIKIISSNSLSGAERREKIQSETRAAADINHLNIARVYESGSTGDGEFYTVTEPISGQTLRECLRKVGVFPEAEAVMIARHAAEALAAAHSGGIVHRAISPANIIIAQDGQKLAVKLQNFDFGGIEQQSTVAGFSDGKPPIDALRYLSPEQCAGQSADARSDIYSLAIVLYEMLCGRSPFGAPTTAAIADRRINEQPLEQLGFDTRALLKHILQQSLQKRPEARPQTAGNFARQLRHIEQLLGLPVMTSHEAAKSSSVNESTAAPVVFNDMPTPEAGESPSEKHQPREMTTQKVADRILPVVPVTAPLPVEKIEENTVYADASFSEPEPIHVEEKEIDAELFSAEPILIKKRESSVVPFESEPIVVRKKQATATTLESEPIFVKRKKADIIAAASQVIDLPDADVKKTRKTVSTAPIFANSLNENRVRHLPTKRPLFVGAGLLALLASVMLGALLYKWQQQSSAAQPTIAAESPVSPASQQPETVSDTSGDTALSDVPESDTAESDLTAIETSAPSTSEKSPAIVLKRENQSGEEIPTTDKAAKQNESTKNQTARENPAATESDRGDGGTRSRVVSADGNAQTELSTSFDRWVTATNSRNVEQQMNYYAPKVNAYYRTKNASPESVRAEKKRTFERADAIDIRTSKPEITVSPDGKTATMRFRKKYVIKQGQQSRNGEVLQELQWVKSGNGWRIVSERDVKVISR